MTFSNHPFNFLVPLFQKHDAEFTFSRYVYTPDSLFDEREIFSLRGDQITEDKIAKEIESLRNDQELAFHSTVRIGGKNLHIPMIDFSIEDPITATIFDRMSRYLPKALMLNMAIYASGRSFHAYSTTLLSPKEWHIYMGKLLLINPRDNKEIVDTRWIGHRLIGGFGSLRWSNSSGIYKGQPIRVPFPA